MRLMKIAVQRVTVVKFGVDSRSSDGADCFRMKVRMDTAEFTEGKIFIQNKTKVACRMSAE